MQGLLPGLMRDGGGGQVMMVGLMSRRVLAREVRSRYVTCLSSTRSKHWPKGETSGNRLEVVSATTDCDRDTLLLQVRVQGKNVVCHNGTRSCFTQSLLLDKPAAQSKRSLP